MWVCIDTVLVVAIVTIVVAIVTIVVTVVTIVVAVGTIIEMLICRSHCLELHRGDMKED